MKRLSLFELVAKLKTLDFKPMDEADYDAFAGASEGSLIAYEDNENVWLLVAKDNYFDDFIQHVEHNSDGEYIDHMNYFVKD